MPNKFIYLIPELFDGNFPGIYIFTNLINNKKYVGQSKNIRKRLKQHEYTINHGKHLCSIHKAILKYGMHNFKIEKYMYPLHLLNTAETLYIKIFDTFNNGYNETTGGDNKRLSKNTIEKKADSTSRLWAIIDPYGNELIIKNLTQFCTKNNLSASKMVAVSTNKRPHHKNWHCKKIDTINDAEQYFDSMRNNELIVYKYIVTYPNGLEEKIQSISKWVIEINSMDFFDFKMDSSSCFKVICGKYRKHNGFGFVRI